MAIIWQKTIDKKKYEIRTAGKIRRLYTNGVCHSEYNPEKIITRSFCDLLVLPAFFYRDVQIKRVLVMGVGGGAVIRQILELLDVEKIIGIEINPTHLYLSKRFYDIRQDGIVELIEADAVEWIKEYAGPPFDLIIEDLYTEDGREPVRVMDANIDWFRMLTRNLSTHGLVVVNYISKTEFRGSAYFSSSLIKKRFGSAFRFTMPGLDNIVGAYLKIRTESSQLRKNIMKIPIFRQAIEDRRLRYRIIKLD